MIKKWFSNLFRKSGIAGSLRQLLIQGDVSWTETNNYQALAREGYIKNVIANKCVSSIANAVADIPLIIKINNKDINLDKAASNKLVQKILRPNDKESYKTFMQNAVCYRLISGNTYFHIIKGVVSNDLVGLELFRPDRVSIELDNMQRPKDFVYSVNGALYRYPIDPLTNLSDVLQIKTFHPLDDLYGLSQISTAAMSIDQHNESSKWNKSMLQNYSRLSGILTLNDRNDNAATLSVEQMSDLSDLVHDKMSGAANAGRVPIINYDMKFQPLSLSPVDMDWLNGRSAIARDICLAFNYPSILLGYPESSTYNNVSEAKLALYEETVIPLANAMLSELSRWLSLHLNVMIELKPDVDKVSALLPRRQIARQNARDDMNAGLITTNEARAEINYPRVNGGDELLVPAGKLPLNFDISQMDQPKYQAWLETECGFTKELAEKYATLAYTKV